MSDSVKCPYCGGLNTSVWGLYPGEPEFVEDDYQCTSCDKKFTLARHVEVWYTATPAVEEGEK